MKLKTNPLIVLGAALLPFSMSAIAQSVEQNLASENEAEEKTVTYDRIMVTARKTEESLLESPVAVSVLDADFFDDTGINTMDNLVKFVTGFDYSPGNTTRANGTRVRGISTFSFSDAIESSVSTIIDGVVMGREAQGFFDLFDVESLEVIKGPQGTLFGKNASAGVVNVRTKRPSFEFAAGGDVTLGSFNQRKIRGSVTGPLSEELAYRFTGTYNVYDGRADNAIDGQDDINDKDTWSLRSKFLWDGGDGLDVLLTIDTVEEENRCCLPTYRYAVPENGTIGAIGGLVSGLQGIDALVGGTFLTDEQRNFQVLQLGAALEDVGIVASPENRSVAVFDSGILQKSSSNGIALTVNYESNIGDFTSITAWRDWEIDENNHADGLAFSDVNNRNGTESSSDQFTQELRLNGSFSDDKVSYVAGLFYFHQDLDADGTVFVELPIAFNSTNRAVRTAETTSFAAFGEFTIEVNDDWSVILGGRFTDESLDATYARTTTAAIDWAGLAAKIPSLPESLQPTAFGLVGGLSPVNPLFGADFSGTQSVEDTDVSGRAIVRYLPTDDFMTYLSFSKGYKGAGIDLAETSNPGPEEGSITVVPNEIPYLWEFGIKGSYFDNSLIVNSVLFHQTVEGLQSFGRDDEGNAINTSIDEVLSRGTEIDIFYYPDVEGLSFSGGVTYLDVKIEKYDLRPEEIGNKLTGVPSWATSLVSNYRFDLGDSGYTGFARLEHTWQSEKVNSTIGAIDGYHLLNFRAGFTSPNDKYTLTFAAENFTDTTYAIGVFGSTYAALDGGTQSHFLGDGRKFSMTLGVKF